MSAKSFVFLQWMGVLLAGASGGCATFEFDVVQPRAVAAHITADQDTRILLNPLEYHFQAAEGRLVMRILNRSNYPIELVGNKSAVVDPDGRSHPLRGETIAAGSFIREILPPFGPEPSGGNEQISQDMGVSPADAPGYILPRGYNPPSRSDAAADNQAYYWAWDGQTEVSVTLVYGQREKSFVHRFTFHRMKK